MVRRRAPAKIAHILCLVANLQPVCGPGFLNEGVRDVLDVNLIDLAVAVLHITAGWDEPTLIPGRPEACLPGQLPEQGVAIPQKLARLVVVGVA